MRLARRGGVEVRVPAGEQAGLEGQDVHKRGNHGLRVTFDENVHFAHETCAVAPDR